MYRREALSALGPSRKIKDVVTAMRRQAGERTCDDDQEEQEDDDL